MFRELLRRVCASLSVCLLLATCGVAEEPPKQLHRVMVGLDEAGLVVARSEKLGQVVLGFENLPDLVFVRESLDKRIKDKRPLTAEIVGYVTEGDRRVFSVKLFNWVTPGR